MSFHRRKKSLVDRELQLGLATRLLIYWAATWLAVFAVPILTQMLMSEVGFTAVANKLIEDLWFPMTMSLLLLPIVARDCVRFSNRIAGPVWRFKQTLRDLNDGKNARPISLRKDDYCSELADEVNRLVEKSNGQVSSQAAVTEADLRVVTNEIAAS